MSPYDSHVRCHWACLPSAGQSLTCLSCFPDIKALTQDMLLMCSTLIIPGVLLCLDAKTYLSSLCPLAQKCSALITSSGAQGTGRMFRIRNLWKSSVVVDRGWQSESTDGLKDGWSCVFLEWLQCLQWSPGQLPHPQLLHVAWCSAAVAVVWWSGSCGVM